GSIASSSCVRTRRSLLLGSSETSSRSTSRVSTSQAHGSSRSTRLETSCSRSRTQLRRRPAEASADLGAAAGAALFHAIDDRAAARLQVALEACEPLVDALPAGADQVD